MQLFGYISEYTYDARTLEVKNIYSPQEWKFNFRANIRLLGYWEGRGVHRVLVGKPEGKRPLGRPRRRWEDNIKIDLQEMGRGGDWMELAQDRDRWWALVNTVMNFLVP